MGGIESSRSNEAVTEPLPPDEVHVWCARQDEIRDPALLARYRALLAPEERARNDAFRFERHAHEHLVTRALACWVLSRYAPAEPAEWRFQRTEYGRPFVVAPPVAIPTWNLSNTEGLVVCAVGAHPLGVDVEKATRGPDILEVAPTVFTRRELAELRSLPEDAQLRRCVTLWTLKEAYIKAIGTGLSAPLDLFGIVFDAAGEPRSIAFDLDDDPAAWQIAAFDVGEHRVGLAVRRGAGPDVRVVVRPTVPLVA
jgi:4'-phosphopantetheinyl transferase